VVGSTAGSVVDTGGATVDAHDASVIDKAINMNKRDFMANDSVVM